jgi:hypothetical protein
MALNLTELTRQWIQHLKNNQIVKGQSDPKTGRLSYNKNPTTQDLIRFLDIKTDFDEEAVRAQLSKYYLLRQVHLQNPNPSNRKHFLEKNPGIIFQRGNRLKSLQDKGKKNCRQDNSSNLLSLHNPERNTITMMLKIFRLKNPGRNLLD